MERLSSFITLILLLFAYSSHAQKKKPTIMILPSDNWCVQRYFTTNYDNQGTTMVIPNYQQAFQEDNEIGLVISKVGEVLTELGYSVKDAEQEIKKISIVQAEDNVTQSKASGANLAETPLDILKRRVKSDVLIQIWWKTNSEPKGTSISFTLEAFDSYTNKRIATSTGTTLPSASSIPVLLEEAVRENAKSFDNQLTSWFADQNINGREISLNIRCWDNWGQDLETNFGNQELLDIIESWLRQNCVNGSFNLSDATETFAQFEQVRIPLINIEGNAIDARSFASQLRKFLQQSPYNISSKVILRGLSEATIVLGEK